MLICVFFIKNVVYGLFFFYNIFLKGNNMSHFERKEIYSINEVLDFLPNPEDYPKGFPLKKITKNYDGDLMKMGSQRYYVFKESLECAHCGIKGLLL